MSRELASHRASPREPLRYHWVERAEEFRLLADEWDKAVVASEGWNPFALSDFVLTWCRHFGEEGSLRVFVARDGDDRIVGGLPLYVRSRNVRDGGARVLHHVGGVAANYTEPFWAVPRVPILPPLLAALQSRSDWDALRLSDVRPESQLLAECISTVSDSRHVVSVQEDHVNFAIDVSAGADRYVASLRSRLRKDLNAKRRHATATYGELRLCSVSGRDEVERWFDCYAAFSRSAFDARGAASSFRHATHRAFFRELLVRLDEKALLDAHVLMGGDRALAVSFGYRLGGACNLALTAYDYECRYVRPGYLLVEALVRESADRGETRFNLFGHEQFYKTQLCNRITGLYQVIVARKSLMGSCVRFVSWMQRLRRLRRLRRLHEARESGPKGTQWEVGAS